MIYSDTDSLKIKKDFDKSVIEEYNKSVIDKIKRVSQKLDIDINRFMPKDSKGEKHILGIFEYEEKDGVFDIITQGAKKYAIKKSDGSIKITVSGVPKKGKQALKKLEDFQNDFVFEYKDTGKNIVLYNDDMKPTMLTDYQGNTELQNFKYGISILPTTYKLGQADEYFDLLSDIVTKRSIFKEMKNE